MSLVAPVIDQILQATVVGPNAPTEYMRVRFHNTGTGAFNRVYRMHPAEYGGEFVYIAKVAWALAQAHGVLPEFLDYHVAHGRSYVYKFQAVDTDGATLDSAQKSAPAVVLTSAWIDTAHKSHQITALVSSNAEQSLQLNDVAPFQNVTSIPAVTRIMAAATKPRVGLGSISKQVLTIPIWIPFGSGDTRATLREMLESIYYICLRTTAPGLEKIFGTISAPREVYSGVTAGIALELVSNSFSEECAP